MWYSSQNSTNTRTSSRAASAAACCFERIGSERSSVGWPLASTSLNEVIDCSSPFSRSSKSSAVRRANRLSVLVHDGDVDANEIGAGSEGWGALFLLLAGLLTVSDDGQQAGNPYARDQGVAGHGGGQS